MTEAQDIQSIIAADFLFYAYTACGSLWLLYFILEDSPCHRSQFTETIYLSVILFASYAAFVCWVEVYDSVDLIVRTSRDAMRIIVVGHVFLHQVFPRSQPFLHIGVEGMRSGDAGTGTHSRATEASPGAAGTLGMAAPSAIRLAESQASALLGILNEAVAIAEQQHRRGGIFPVFLLLIMMVEDLCRAYDIEASAEVKATLETMFVFGNVILTASVILTFLRWSARRRMIHDVLSDILDDQAADVLQYVLTSAGVSSLVAVASWTTLTQLVERALEHDLLNVWSKAMLVSALQVRGIRRSPCAQTAVWRLITSCKGSELNLFKNLIDSTGTYHNLYKLVYQDISDKQRRRDIMRHLTEQAQRMRESKGGAVGIKVMSDIDDTLYSSGGHFPAGCDSRFPRHVVYPGFLRLVELLDKSFRPGEVSCGLVFLSARPHLYKDVAEEKSFSLFSSMIRSGRMHTMPTLLPGRLLPGLAAFCSFPCLKTTAWRWVGNQKYQTYVRYRDLYKEYDFVFFGDNGQGDLLAGQRMLREARDTSVPEPKKAACEPREADPEPSKVPPEPSEGAAPPAPLKEGVKAPVPPPNGTADRIQAPPPVTIKVEQPEVENIGENKKSVEASDAGNLSGGPKLLGVVIHEVMAQDQSLQLNIPGRESLPVVMHRSYVGAALALHRANPELVSVEDLAAIMASAHEDFEIIRMSNDRLVRRKWTSSGAIEKWREVQDEMRLDMQQAAEVVEAAGLTVPTEINAEAAARTPRQHRHVDLCCAALCGRKRPKVHSSGPSYRAEVPTALAVAALPKPLETE